MLWQDPVGTVPAASKQAFGAHYCRANLSAVIESDSFSEMKYSVRRRPGREETTGGGFRVREQPLLWDDPYFVPLRRTTANVVLKVPLCQFYELYHCSTVFQLKDL